MAKRIMLAVVGAGMGALVGLLIDFLGAGGKGVVICGIAGALLPFAFLHQPGR